MANYPDSILIVYWKVILIMIWLFWSLILRFYISNSIFKTISKTVASLLEMFIIVFVFYLPILAEMETKRAGVACWLFILHCLECFFHLPKLADFLLSIKSQNLLHGVVKIRLCFITFYLVGFLIICEYYS